jgi:hypothetical protein
MKLIDTREAGEILGVHYSRIRTLVKQGHLKDYNEVNPKAKKHYTKVSVTEVREFKRTHVIGYRGAAPKHVETNGHAPVIIKVKPRPVVTEVSAVRPMESITDRLTRIEEKMDILLKLWV